MDRDKLHTAKHHVMYAADGLAMAYAASLVGQPRPRFLDDVIERLSLAAEELGYSLVKRQPMTPAMLEAVGEDVAMGR